MELRVQPALARGLRLILIVVLSCSVGFGLFIDSAKAQNDAFQQRQEDIEFYLEQELKIANCSTKSLKYYHGFPAWVTGARDRDRDYETGGKVASDQYRTLSHLSVHKQHFVKGEKSYIKPAFVKRLDKENLEIEPEERFIGFVVYKVAQVIEPYTPAKHDQLNLITHPEVVPGNTPVRPHYFWKKVRTKPRHYKSMKFVAYENCYNPKILLPDASLGFIDGLRNEFGDEHFESFFSGVAPTSSSPRNQYDQIPLYGPQDLPTLLGYREHVYNKLRADLNLDGYDNFYEGAVLVRNLGLSVIPGVGTAMSVNSCIQAGDISCWADVALDGAADGLFFLKFAKLAQLSAKVGR